MKQLLDVLVPCKSIKDNLGFWIPRRGFRILGTGFQSLSVELGFWTAILRGFPDSLSCIADSKAQDSGFHKQVSWILDSTSKTFFLEAIDGRQEMMTALFNIG